MVPSDGWLRVHTTYDGFEAKLLAARLGAEGIVCELRGAVDSAYPVGPAHLFVPADEADDARAVLALAAEPVELTGDEPSSPRPARPGRALLLLSVGLAMMAVTLGRMLVAGH